MNDDIEWMDVEDNESAGLLEIPNMQYAPTTNPKRPRARAVGYDPKLKVLYILFRKATSNSPALWQYENVDRSVWESLRKSDSTGKWLREFDYDNWPDKAPVQAGSIEYSREQLRQKTVAMVGKERFYAYGYDAASLRKFGVERPEKLKAANSYDKVAAWYAKNNPEKGRKLGIL